MKSRKTTTRCAKRGSNAGKTRFWLCANVEHYYDDFVNTHLCNHPKRTRNECPYGGNMMRQYMCPLFERGAVSRYVKCKKEKQQPKRKSNMKNYTSLADFSEGCAKISQVYPTVLGASYEEMPVLLSVDGLIAPFGIMTTQIINGVECMVFSGLSKTMENISVEKRQENIDAARKSSKEKGKKKRK